MRTTRTRIRTRGPRFPLGIVAFLAFLVLLFALSAVPLLAQSTPIEQARAAMTRGDNDAAIPILEKAVAQSPQSAEAHYYLANAYAGKGQQSGMLGAASWISKMKAEYEKAIAINPKYLDARFGLLQFYSAAPGMIGGSDEKALEQAKQIKAIDPLFGHRAYAFIYSQQKKLDLANKEFAAAVREEPGSAKAHTYFGQYLTTTEKNYAAANTELEAAVKIDPGYMPAFYHLGRTAALGSTNYARGEEALTKYLAYTPKENEPTLASAHYHLGTIYEKQGKKAPAKKEYETALKLNPTLKQAAEALKRVS